MATSRVERISADDLMSLAAERGSTPMQVGAALFLTVDGDFDPASVLDAIRDRVPTVPRLRQRLLRVPLGFGRPVWTDDPDFQIENHVSVVSCPEPGGVQAVLDIAAELLTTRLRQDRPLWCIRIITHSGEGQAALVAVFHHVLADGIAGLAVLAGIVDGAERISPVAFPRTAPTRRALFADALMEHVRTIRRLPQALRRLGAAFTELRPAVRPLLPRSSLNQPTGPRRRYASLRFSLQRIIAAAHQHDATVNDLLLAAITGALHALLQSRGETLDHFVLSVPVSDRRETTIANLGNRSGVIPLVLPGTGDPASRLELITRITRAAKLSPRAASNALIGPVFRTLGRTGVYRRFIDHQRLVNTFVTNVKGPAATMSLAGNPVTEILPLGVAAGNVTVSFAALSYAGNLVLTIATDPDACPDLDNLAEAIRGEVLALARVD